MSTPRATYTKKRILTIAGSDCSGGAGIQADLEQIYDNDCLASTVITALVSETETTVSKVTPTPISHLQDELTLIEQAHKDSEQNFEIHAIKIGLITTQEQLELISKFVETMNVPTVLDPVIKATAGDTLLIVTPIESFIKNMVESLIPKVSLITPNQKELSTLIKHLHILNKTDWHNLSKKLNTNLLIKNAPCDDTQIARDYLILQNSETLILDAEKVVGADLHGSGCRYSTNIACNLSRHSLPKSTQLAKEKQTRLYQKNFSEKKVVSS